MKRIIRVFPRRTAATPDDEMVRVNTPPGLFDEADEVHVSVAFTWDLPTAEKLAHQWGAVAPVQIGGPATGDTGGDFVPGMYVKKGYTIHHRGCPNKCWFCVERKTEMRLLEIHDGWNDISSNLLACPKEHFYRVMGAMKRGAKKYGKRAEFTGGLEAARLTDWHIEALRELRPKQMFFAYDTPDDLEPLQRAGEMLLDAGWTTASHTLRAYVLCGYPKDTFAEASHRMQEVQQAGFMPMAMLYRDKQGKRERQWMKWQREWARPAIIAKAS
jgi:hypothetical protein